MSASPTRLQWAVKESFLDYIRALEDGTIDTFDGCVNEGDAYVFPEESSDDSGRLFSGGIHFRGFAGMLDVRLVDPMIEEGDERRLTALVGPSSIAARVVIATLDGAEPLQPGEPWTATPRLTFEGVRLFGDVYQVGAELAPLMVVPEGS